MAGVFEEWVDVDWGGIQTGLLPEPKTKKKIIHHKDHQQRRFFRQQNPAGGCFELWTEIAAMCRVLCPCRNTRRIEDTSLEDR